MRICITALAFCLLVSACGDNSSNGTGGSGGTGGTAGTGGTGGNGGSGGTGGTGGMAGSGGSGGTGGSGGMATGLNKLNHIVVIYLENHSFDNLYGSFPGASGMSDAATRPQQQDLTGTVYTTLPQPINTGATPPGPDSRFPATLANAMFDITQYVPANQDIPDLVHRYYQEQAQIHGGAMDRFAAVSNAAGLAMGYYPTDGLPLKTLASQYTLCDHFFHGVFGGSYMNHIWLVSANVATFPNAPTSMVAVVDSSGNMTTDGAVSPDFHVINTAFTVNNPHPSNVAAANLVPNQTFQTIGDLLNAHNVTWAWYSGGWNAALAGFAPSSFQFHHQPFAYFTNFGDGTAAKRDHLKDETDLTAAIAAGTLPQVVFWKPVGVNNEHPGYTDIVTGENHTLALVQSIMTSPLWRDTAIIITYDEHGGFYDHVAPPTRDVWGPGSRVPALVISPYAKRNFVDHTVYATESILSLIEHRFSLGNLGGPDATAPDMEAAFDFTQMP